MSETVTNYVVEAEENVGTSGDFINETTGSNQEIKDTNWDTDNLTPLVRANAHVLVRPSWMGGEIVTLGTAMDNYPWKPEGTIPEDEPFLMSIVYDLLANAVIEAENAEEPAEEDLSQEGSDQVEEGRTVMSEESDRKNKTEVRILEVQENKNAIIEQEQPKNEIEAAANLEPVVSQAENTSKPESGRVAKADVAGTAVLIQAEPHQPSTASVKSEAAVSSLIGSAEETNENTTRAPEARVIAARQSERAQLEPRHHETSHKFIPPTKPSVKTIFDTKQQKPPRETIERDVVTAPIFEKMPVPVGNLLASDQPPKLTTTPIVAEHAAELRTAQDSSLELENSAIYCEFTEPGDGEIELVEDEPSHVAFDYQTGIYDYADFEEDEIVLLDHQEEVGMAQAELYLAPDTLDIKVLGEHDEAGGIESVYQLGNEAIASDHVEITEQGMPDLTIEKIGNTLIQLTELIEVGEPDAVEKIKIILDEIIEVSAKLEVCSSENNITEAEVQDELEELFVELFDLTGIEYTPELIESLASLTLKCKLADDVEVLENTSELNETGQGSGTHEIFNKLLVGLSTLAKAEAHAWAIGQSALALYTSKLAA